MSQTMEREKHCVYGHGKMWWRGERIGKGGFGSVFLATHKKPKSRMEPFPTQMAVKSAKNCSSGSLRNERKILEKLRNCPHVIQCFGEEVTKGIKGENIYNLLLEYASEGSLRDRMNKLEGCKFPESEVKRYTRSILEGIKSVHELGFAHRDIKPANVLLIPVNVSEFKAKLCDFGMAKRVQKGDKVKYLGGTARYLSPEAIVESLQEGPSDIWAVGCVVFELLTGKRVWDNHWNTKNLIHMIGYEFGVPEIPSELSKEAKQFLKGCFVRNPKDRFSANMLLKLPFVDCIDSVGDDQEYRVFNSSIRSFSGNDDDPCDLVYNEEYMGDFRDDEEYGYCVDNVGKEHETYVEEEASVCRFDDADQHVLFVEDVTSICEYVDGEAHGVSVEGEPSVCNYGEIDEDMIFAKNITSYFEYINGAEHGISAEEEPSYCENGDDGDEEEDPEYCYSQQDENSVEVVHDFKRRRV